LVFSTLVINAKRDFEYTLEKLKAYADGSTRAVSYVRRIIIRSLVPVVSLRGLRNESQVLAEHEQATIAALSVLQDVHTFS